MRIWRCSGVGVVTGNGIVREQSQGLDIVACCKMLKRPNANVTCSNAGEHTAQEGPFLAHYSFPGGNGRECSGSGNAERGHGFADNVFADYGAKGGFAITAARERRAS